MKRDGPVQPPPKPRRAKPPQKPKKPIPPSPTASSPTNDQETLLPEELSAEHRQRVPSLVDNTERRAEAPYIGKTIDDRYEVLSVLGEGGMGVVYRARRRVFDKIVALKILRADLVHKRGATERFMTEAKAASAIGSAHIVDVFDYGYLPDGSAYFAMELLEGPSLADLIDRGDLLASMRAVRLTRQIAEGLADAHAANIIHRDLKPDNIFVIQVEGADFVKIVDFGIAKVLGLQNQITRAGAIFGTPHYMSPEQCKGQPVDHRSDIYSLGVMFYEMLTGEVPFDAENPLSILSQHLNDRPPPFPDLGRPQPVGAEEALMCCMAKAPSQRFQSMGELAEALAEVERGQAEAGVHVPISVAPPRTEPPANSVSDDDDRVPHARRQGTHLEAAIDAAIQDAEAEREWAKRAKSSSRLWLGVALLGVCVFVAVALAVGAGRPAKLKPTMEPARLSFAAVDTELWEKPEPPKEVDLILSPIDARVYRGGKSLGSMPISVSVDPGKEVELEVRRKGYQTRRVSVNGALRKKEITLRPNMDRKPAAKAAMD